MADLFNLDAELLADQDPRHPDLQDDDGDGNVDVDVDHEDLQQEEDHLHGEEWDDDHQGDAEQVEVLALSPTATAATTAADSTQQLPHQQERFDLEDIAASASDQDLEYTKLYSFWMQEMQAPELLPFPAALVDRIQESIANANAHTNAHTNANANTNANATDDSNLIDTGNEGLDALLTSLLTIDTDRVTFLLADLLKRRLQKIEAHPLHMETKLDCMSPHEQSFWQDYRELVRRHLHQTVTQHFPDRENWRDIIPGEPDLDHTYCFAHCVHDVAVDQGQGDVRPLTAGSRIIVRYDKIKHHVQQGDVLLV